MTVTWADPDVGWADPTITWTGEGWTPPPPPPPPEPTPQRATPRVARWQFVVGDDGALEAELVAARTRRITWRLDGPAEASFTIDGRHRDAAAVTELVTDLHVFRDGDRLYRGRVGATGDDIDADTHRVTFATADYRAVLARRLLFDADQREWTATEQADIAWDAIAATQAKPGGDLGITLGDADATGVDRDIEAPAGQTVGGLIDTVSRLDDGFDWEIDHDLAFNLWTARGGSNGVVLDYGGMVALVTRRFDPATYANALRVSGHDELTPIAVASADVATRPEGRWEAQYGFPDILADATLAARAAWQLAEAQEVEAAWTVTLAPGRWGGPDHLWLGDTATLVVRSGRLDVAEAVRVRQVSVSVGDSGEETVEVVVGAQPQGFAERQRDAQRRLAALERR